MNLKYLFEVVFEDGEVYKQSKDDVSKTDSKRSAFYDILNDRRKIKSFTIKKLFDKWSVDLESGVFEHNGVKFQLEENYLKRGKIEFFRQHQHDVNFRGEELEHRVIYFLGYSRGSRKYLIGIK